MSSWGAAAASSSSAEEQPMQPPPQTVYRKPVFDFSPELRSAPSWEEHPNSTKKRPPSTAGSVKKKRGTPARDSAAWSDWKTAPTTTVKPILEPSICTTAAPDCDTSTDSAGPTFRFSSFPASLPRISAPETRSYGDSSFSLLMTTPRAKLDFALGASGPDLYDDDHHEQLLSGSSPQFQQPSFASSSLAAADVSTFTKSLSNADATESTAALTPNRTSTAVTSDCPDTPREVQLHFTDAGCSPIASVAGIPEEKSGSSTSSRPLPDMNAFGDVNSSASSSEPRLLCPPTPVRTPAWAGGRNASPDHSLMDTRILAGDAADDDNHEVLATLGRGNFADVFKIATSDGQRYALKYHRRAFRGHRDRAAAVKEVQVMLQLQGHAHVLQLHRAWQCEGHFFMQTELCCRATCRDLLDCNEGLTMDVVAKIGHDVADGLSFVHSAGFVHNDIKPSNILFHLVTAECKIGDFGMAVATSDSERFVEGDQRYMAPEMLVDNASRAASDVFSLGLTLYEAGSGALIPSEGPRWHALRNGSAIDLFRNPNNCNDLERLVASMMHPTVTERPNAAAVCERLGSAAAAPNSILQKFVKEAEREQPLVAQQRLLHSPPETGRFL